MSLRAILDKLDEIEKIEPEVGWEACDTIEGLRTALETAQRLGREAKALIIDYAEIS